MKDSHFLDFNLDKKLLKSLAELGYETPTAIQNLAIPKILSGVDIIASAQTGTGKTAAFLLPVLHLTLTQYFKNEGASTLILVPTRELAMQVAEEAKKFSKYTPHLKVVCLYGGVPYPPQRRALSSRHHIIVATPGRLIDHMQQGRVNLSHLKMLILDEADRMLDMGFVGAVEQIAAASPKTRQTLLFSATIDKKILPISKKLQNAPHEIEVEAQQQNHNNIEQRLYYVDNIHHKMRLLDHILENPEINQTIVFTSTKSLANELAMQLQEKGHLSDVLHGDLNQRQRTRTINKMRKGSINVLIATDVAARGIDISTISHVVNFDLPHNPEDFIHRIGRTGRAGASGVAITFATYEEERWISKVNTLLHSPLESATIAGLEPRPKPERKFRDDKNASNRPHRGKPRNFKPGFKPRFKSNKPRQTTAV